MYRFLLTFSCKVADQFGLDHHEIRVRSLDGLQLLSKLVWHYGQPFGDATAVPTHWKA
jgi:asparagine synthase (glutamine-hydrolysing)